MTIKMFKRTFSTLLILFLVLNITSLATIQEDIYNLSDGVEYLDKTFVYEVVNTSTGNRVLALCAEKEAPTYDSKKGLMTWVDYRVYNLEEIFDENVAKQVRAIINVVGPQREEAVVVAEMKARTGLDQLRYEEIVSAMQYSIWFYTDQVLTKPTTENGEALYRLLVTLPPAENTVETDVVTVTLDSIERRADLGIILMKYHYQSEVPAELAHVYSKNIITTYNAKETVTKTNGTTSVQLEFPIITEDMTIDFEVIVKGTLDRAGVVTAFAPDNQGESQMLVGYNVLQNSMAVLSGNGRLAYKSHRLVLIDEEDVTRNGFNDGSFVTLAEINDLNQTGREGKSFLGWFDENGIIVTNGVLMDKNRELHAVYESNTSSIIPDENTPEGNVPGDNTPGGSTPGTSTPDGNTPEGIIPSGNTPDGNTPDQNTDLKDPLVPEKLVPTQPNVPEQDEPFPDEETPKDLPGKGWIPKTGGIPLLIFLLVGSLSFSVGVILRRRKRNFT